MTIPELINGLNLPGLFEISFIDFTPRSFNIEAAILKSLSSGLCPKAIFASIVSYPLS